MVHVLNKYHHKNILMISYSGRRLIPKSRFFCSVLENHNEVEILVWNQYLTKSTPSKIKFKWNEVEQIMFEEIKRIVACNILLSYPGFNKQLTIYTDAIYFQL